MKIRDPELLGKNWNNFDGNIRRVTWIFTAYFELCTIFLMMLI